MLSKIKVEGMSCGHCSKSVFNTINAIEGVNNVDVNLELGEATINYDENIVNISSIAKEINKTHYRASIL